MKIREGLFYRARDGRKVGPMVRWQEREGEEHWEYRWTNDESPREGRLWRYDGTSGVGMPEHDLVSEWVDPERKITGTFKVCKQVSDSSWRPYFLVETMKTSDGPRDRICNGRWNTLESAIAEAEERSKRESE